MMNNHHQAGVSAYGAARKTQTPIKVLVELYDAAFASVSKAKAFKLESRVEDEFNAVVRATQILHSLDSILEENDDRAKNITEVMHAYYKTTLVQLHRAKQSKSPDAELRYASVQRQLLTMRDAWATVAGVPLMAKPSIQAQQAKSA